MTNIGKEEGLSADMEKKNKAIMHLKEVYYGFEEFEYEVALEVGNLDYFENNERDLVHIPMSKLMSESGPRFRDLFNQRVRDYFTSRDKIRQALWRS